MNKIMDVSRCKDNSIYIQKDSIKLLLKLTLTFIKGWSLDIQHVNYHHS